ncbi:MAG: dephospho-CoA kinase [Candidatus Puniceispirillaceae bacterium]
MIVVGLTGGIASGKSTTAAMIRDRGIPVHDADRSVHAMMAPGGVAVAPVTAAFGDELRADDGSIDRQALGAMVFAAPSRRAVLEAVIHPLVAADRDRFLAQSRETGAPLVVLDVPLLFETGGESLCDFIILCAVDPDIQRRRAMQRPGMTAGKLDAILASQMPLAQKRDLADAVIDTGDGVTAAAAQLAAILDGPVAALLDGRQQITDPDNA